MNKELGVNDMTPKITRSLSEGDGSVSLSFRNRSNLMVGTDMVSSQSFV